MNTYEQEVAETIWDRDMDDQLDHYFDCKEGRVVHHHHGYNDPQGKRMKAETERYVEIPQVNWELERWLYRTFLHTEGRFEIYENIFEFQKAMREVFPELAEGWNGFKEAFSRAFICKELSEIESIRLGRGWD